MLTTPGRRPGLSGWGPLGDRVGRVDGYVAFRDAPAGYVAFRDAPAVPFGEPHVHAQETFGSSRVYESCRVQIGANPGGSVGLK